jgi:hypothetical protein
LTYHYLDSSECKKAIKGSWNIKQVLEDKMGGPLDNFDILKKIPTLNAIQNEADLRELDGQLVRFSGFVQDMIDQDFFIGHFMSKKDDFSTGIPNKYLYLSEDDLQEVDNDMFTHCQENYTMNRGNLITTSIPNENKWVREKRGIEDGRFEEVAEI